MAINISIDPLYSGRFTPASPDYPFGSAQDETVPGSSNDGTPIILNFVDDYLGFHQAILEEDGETPTGNADTAIASQYFNGLMRTSDIYPNLLDTGGVDTIVITPSPAIKEYKANQHFRVAMNNTNAGAVTINSNGLGAIQLLKLGLVPLVAFDLLEGQFYDIITLSPTAAFVQNPEIPNLEEQTAANSASLDFAVDSTFKTHQFDLYNIRPITDGTRLLFQISDDNGATFKSGATDYKYSSIGINGAIGSFTSTSQADVAIRLNTSNFGSGVGQGVGEFGINGRLLVLMPGAAFQTSQVPWQFSYVNTIGETVYVSGGGSFVGTQVITNVRFSFLAGNIDIGTIRRSSQ